MIVKITTYFEMERQKEREKKKKKKRRKGGHKEKSENREKWKETLGSFLRNPYENHDEQWLKSVSDVVLRPTEPKETHMQIRVEKASFRS